jgi:predicted deacylase
VPGQTTIAAAINVSGTIAARRQMPVGVAGEGGQVIQVLVDAGDWVRAGQVLAVMIAKCKHSRLQASRPMLLLPMPMLGWRRPILTAR